MRSIDLHRGDKIDATALAGIVQEGVAINAPRKGI
jgi:hypothetical protein